MHTIRYPKATYSVAFFIGALLALLIAAPARAAEPFQLDRIGVVRFTAEGDGTLRRQNAVLHANGQLNLRGASSVPRPANAPAWVLGRNLISIEAWLAYHSLGTGALQQFELHDGGARVYFGDEAFLLVAPNFEGPFATGRVLNLSAQLRISGVRTGVAGFVIEDQSRTVLIRAVGPTLRQFGVVSPAGDPFLRVKRDGVTIYSNDDWNEAPNSAAIRDAAVRVGAFPLQENGFDSALILILPPGAYTVAVTDTAIGSESPEADVLLEVYSVPPGFIEIQPAGS